MSTPMLRNNITGLESRTALKSRRIFDDDDDDRLRAFPTAPHLGLQSSDGFAKSPPQLKAPLRMSDITNGSDQSSPMSVARAGQAQPSQEPLSIKPSPVMLSTERPMSNSNGRDINRGQSFGDYDYRNKPELQQRLPVNPLIPQPSFGGQLMHSPQVIPRQPMHSTPQVNLEQEIASLQNQKVAKEKELYELRRMLGLDGQASASPGLLAQCIDSHKRLKAQEAELKDLKLNYNLLKEETEKQRLDLVKLESGNDLDRIPRTKDELAAQNEKIKQRIKQMNRDYDKTLYDKTLDIEMKARSKMYQIAMDIAVQHIDSKDTEMQELMRKVRQLEAENNQLELEVEKNLTASLIN